MAIIQVNGSGVTSTSTRNDGGVFIKGISNNNAPITTYKNAGAQFYSFGSTVVSGVNTAAAISSGIFANNSRGLIIRATDIIAGIDNNVLVFGNNPDWNRAVPVQYINTSLSRFPLVRRRIKNYNYGRSIRTEKVASAIRSNKYNRTTGKFSVGFPESSHDFWTPFTLTDALAAYDANNPASYSGSGTTLYDLSDNNNDATLINGVSYTAAGYGTSARFSFDGTNDYMDTPITYGGTNDCSFGCWMKAPNSAQKCGLIGFRSQFVFGSPSITQCLIYLTGDINAGTVGKGLTCHDWSGGYAPGAGTFSISKNRIINGLNTVVCDGNWHHIMVTRSSTSTRLYVDNVLIGESFGATPEINSTTIFKVGVAGNGGSNNLGGFYYTGDIATVYFYDRALTADEVARNYYAFNPAFYA